MARMCKTAFAQLLVMLSSEAGKTRIFFFQPKSNFGYTHLTL